MATEAAPTKEDLTAIAQIAREMLKAADPSDAFDPTSIFNVIQSDHPSIVLRDSGWYPGADEAPEAVGPGKVVGWAVAYDRNDGRVNGMFAAERGNEDYVAHTARLLEWQEKATREILERRGIDSSIIVNEAGEKDVQRQAALEDAGYEKTRTWVYMERPLTDADRNPDITEDVTIRRILTEADRREAHDVLEDSFKDHFNSFEETFEEFTSRIELFPGHDWGRDFIAEVEIDGEMKPVGAILAGWQPVSNSVMAEYLGVTSDARGRGVAKALFQALFAEAVELGFIRAELEVDAESPTGANEAYVKLGFAEDYRVDSWHKTITRN